MSVSVNVTDYTNHWSVRSRNGHNWILIVGLENVHLIHHKNSKKVCCNLHYYIYYVISYAHLENDVKAKVEKSDKKRAGYCECCGVRFDDFTLVSDITPIYYALVNLAFVFSTSMLRESSTWLMLQTQVILPHWMHYMICTTSQHLISLWQLRWKGV